MDDEKDGAKTGGVLVGFQKYVEVVRKYSLFCYFSYAT